MAALEPLRPGEDPPFDRACAAHLARRAGFGARPEEIDRLVDLGVDGAVASFIDAPDDDARLAKLERSHGSALSPTDPMDAGAASAVARLRARLMWRMVESADPLREKLCLFWHDHFATAESKVLRLELIEGQWSTFRRYGSARFRDLLGAVARDPAMLVYLDNRVSKKQHPNENWARELLELFTLGVDRYEQRDVAELARVFTGWTTPDRNRGPFEFDSGDHDSHDKLFLGHSIRGRRGAAGEQEGDEALDLLTKRPECARHIAGSLCAAFVAHAPPADLVDEVAEVFAREDTSIANTLRALFTSRRFYEARFRENFHRTPIDWAVSAARAIRLSNAHLSGWEARLARMGMKLFEPPSVAGWESGREWLQSSQLAERFELALQLSQVAHSSRSVFGAPAADFDALAVACGPEDPAGPSAGAARLVDTLAWRLLGRELDAASRAALVEHLEVDLPASADGDGSDATAVATVVRERVRALVHLLLCSPQFTLA